MLLIYLNVENDQLNKINKNAKIKIDFKKLNVFS